MILLHMVEFLYILSSNVSDFIVVDAAIDV